MTLWAQVLRGMLFATSVVAAVFFAKFRKRSGDRFFTLFSVAFGLLALNWIGVAVIDPHEESRKWVYVIRLVAFVLILAAIVDKNREK